MCRSEIGYSLSTSPKQDRAAHLLTSRASSMAETEESTPPDIPTTTVVRVYIGKSRIIKSELHQQYGPLSPFRGDVLVSAATVDAEAAVMLCVYERARWLWVMRQKALLDCLANMSAAMSRAGQSGRGRAEIKDRRPKVAGV